MSQKANIRSPYFLKYQDTDLTRVELDLHVYSGTVETDKGDPVYSLENDVIAGQNYAIFEVSEFTSDYFEHSFTGTYYSNTLWFTAVARLYDSSDQLISTFTQHFLAMDGYTAYEDGVNAQGNRGALTTTSTIFIPENETYKLPVFSEDVISVTMFTPQIVGSAATSLWNTETREWQLNDDYWDTQASADTSTLTETATLSTGKIQYATIPSTVRRVTVTTASGAKDYVVNEVCAEISGKRKLTFVNKHGALEDLWFTGLRKDTVNTTGSEYKATPIDFGTMTYSSSSPQINRNHVNGEYFISLNTGWVHEDVNSSLEELIMSQNVWLTEDNVVTPMIVVGNSLEKISQKENNIVQYNISLKKAHNINNTAI